MSELVKVVVDAMGGVTFDVPMDMDVDGTTIYAGEQELSGDLALKVCRYRHGYAMADIQREYVWSMEDIEKLGYNGYPTG